MHDKSILTKFFANCASLLLLATSISTNADDTKTTDDKKKTEPYKPTVIITSSDDLHGPNKKNDYLKNIKHSIGFGFQYGTLIGYNLSYDHNEYRARAGVGLVGISVGADYFVHDKFSVGATYTGSFRNVYSINLTSYPNTRYKGMHMGIDFVHMPADKVGIWSVSTAESKNMIWFKFGYTF
jgi:hypothetical protein